MPSIADLILEQGRAQAAGPMASGQIWGQGIARLGDLVRQTREQGVQERELAAQQAARSLSMDATRQQMTQGAAAAGREQTTFDAQQATLARKDLAIRLHGIATASDPAMKAAMWNALKTSPTVQKFGVPLPDQLPGDADLNSEAESLLPDEKPIIVPGIGAIHPITSRVLVKEPPKAVSVGSGGLALQQPDGSVTQVIQPPPKDPTGADQDARYRNIVATAARKLPVSDEDKAWAQAYEKSKLLGPEAAAAAAGDRQATAIGAQVAQQSRAQDFQEQQAGRKELQDKIESPYLDAREKADTLNSVIDAAKNGNMAAANVQSLMGLLGLVTAEGVKRINSVELAQVQGAGNLLERIKGQVGGLVSGQPLSPRLQADLKQLSDVLQKSARAKYEQGFTSTTKRYRLNDEKMLPNDAVASVPDLSGLAAGHGRTFTVGPFAGQTWTTGANGPERVK